MLTTTTTRAVNFHGWTLPAGSVVTISKIVREVFSPVEQFTTASCTSDAAPHGIAVPTDALSASHAELSALPWRTDYI